MASDGRLAVVGEDDEGLLASVDLRFAGELATDEVNGAAGFDQGLGQAEDVDEDGTLEFGQEAVGRTIQSV